jgi:hypothetical protein
MKLETDPIVELAVFGQEVERFMDSSIGVYVSQKIADEIEHSMQELRTVNPQDAGAVSAAQAKAQVMLDLSMWLRQAIAAGTQAQEALRESASGDDT